jgi:hypothetical protein
VYNDHLPFGARAVGFRQHWKEELALLEQDFAALQAERAKAPDKPGPIPAPGDRGLKPPSVSLPTPPPAEHGKDLRITAKVASAGDVQWMKLRYRHLSQYEDYQTAEMTLDAKTGLYSGAIPAAYIDQKWDVMYFVEVVGRNGAGRMYPDLEREMPYVIVPVKR